MSWLAIQMMQRSDNIQRQRQRQQMEERNTLPLNPRQQRVKRMTYQELLVEFSQRRLRDMGADNAKLTNDPEILTIQWAIQSILEKLRDGDKE